jgi:MarR family transcriptional regulator, organic hydroperoxide resistance regulator
MGKPEILSKNDPILHDVVDLFRELLHAVLSASGPVWIDLQLTLPQLRTLFIVAHNKTSSVMQIAKHLGIGEPTASHLIEKLVQAGLVDRSDDPMDRRRAIIQLSSLGEGLIEKLFGWEEFMGVWLYKIPREDLFLLQRGLNAIMNEAHRQTAGNEQASEDFDQEVSTQW